MKKRISVRGLVICMLLFSMVLSGCDSSIGRAVSNAFGESEITYEGHARFLYSLDGGVSWSETIQEISVDTTYYLAVEMQVTQSESTKEEKAVVATITIPSTNVLDCYLDDHPGVSITGKTDAATNSISYDFNVVAGTSPTKFRVVFECKPLDEGRAQFQVVFDDNVSENWDATGTIKYVAKSETSEKTDENSTDKKSEEASD